MKRLRHFQQYVTLFTANSFCPHDPAHVPKYSHYFQLITLLKTFKSRQYRMTPQFIHSSSCCTVSQHKDMHIKTDIAHSRMFWHGTLLISTTFWIVLQTNHQQWLKHHNVLFKTRHFACAVLSEEMIWTPWTGSRASSTYVHTYRHNLPTRKHNYYIYWNK